MTNTEVRVRHPAPSESSTRGDRASHTNIQPLAGLSAPKDMEIGNDIVPLEAREMILSVSQLATVMGYSEGHLRRLLRLNKVEGVKVGTLWLSTESAAQKYLRANGKG